MMAILQLHRAERGVSLMETLVALFILSAVGVAVIAGVYTTVKANEVARTQITAESLARTELEYISSQPFSTGWTSYTSPPPTVHPSCPVGWDTAHTMPTGYTGYSITISPSELVLGTDPGGTMSNKQKITAVVSYNGGQVISISTYLAERK